MQAFVVAEKSWHAQIYSNLAGIQAPPVNASIYSLDILVFSGGAYTGECGTTEQILYLKYMYKT